MDRSLNNIFDEYDILQDEPAEQEYAATAREVSERFDGKMELVGKKLRFAQDLIALFRYFTDPEVVWYRKTIVVAALAYFIAPMDAIPDIAPLIGYLDDFGVILAVVKYMGKELQPYYP